jgi:hypothetical protein
LVRLEIPVHTVAAGTVLQHVGRLTYLGTQLYFSRNKECRYDDPLKVYGVLYLGFDLNTSIMESVFHKHQWSRGARTISTAEVSKRMVRFVGVKKKLRLAHITAPGIMAPVLGLNLSQLLSRRYGHTQRLSAHVHRNLDSNGKEYDGILYPSRNNYPADCIALFSRAASKIVLQRDIELVHHRHWPSFVVQHKVKIVPT